MSPFRPSAARAWSVDRAVRARTAESLAALGQGLSAQIPGRLTGIERLISALRSGPVRPAVFALYSDLALSIHKEEGDGLLSTLAAADGLEVTACSGLRAVTISDDFLGPGMAARYVRHVDDDPIVPISLLPLIFPSSRRLRTHCRRRFARPRSGWAACSGSYQLVREIVFCASGDDVLTFGGSTTSSMFGEWFLMTGISLSLSMETYVPNQ